MSLKIVAISDTHTQHHKFTIPECDILIHAGDYSHRGREEEVEDFYSWLDDQPANHKISVQGNHELWVEKNFELAKSIAQSVCPGVHFIQEEGVQIEGIKIFGSSWTPFFCNWAWNAHRGIETRKHAALIPLDTELLITHGPAYDILDYIPNQHTNVGCDSLLNRILESQVKLHICGHIHEGKGSLVAHDKLWVNAAALDGNYRPTSGNPTVIIRSDTGEYTVETQS